MRKYLSVIVFLCVIFGFTIGSAVVPSKKFSEMEKRNLQQKPKVSVSSVVKGSYQKKYEKYLSDQFFLRDKWVNIYAQLEKNTGKKEINNVYIGKDDYLIEKYSERDFDDELQKMNVKNLALFLDACSEELGKSNVTCMFVPSKIDVLRNKLSVLEEDYDGSKIVERVRSKVKNKDYVLIAAGFLGTQDYVAKAFGVKLNARTNVETAEGSYKTSVDKVFTAGDMHRGQSLVVWGINEGRHVAREVDEFLMGYTNLP